MVLYVTYWTVTLPITLADLWMVFRLLESFPVQKCLTIQRSLRSVLQQSNVTRELLFWSYIERKRTDQRHSRKLMNHKQTSGSKFIIFVDEILLLNKFFPIVDTCLSCEGIARQSCAMVPRWRFLATFLGPAFAASRVQHISDLHSKFALGPHHVSKYGRHPIYGRWD